MMKYIINTDGGARGNPGPAASAFIIKTAEGSRVKQQGDYLGVATNNEAEYAAVLNALEFLVESHQDVSTVTAEIRADSLLIVKQLSDEWKIKNDRLRVFYNKIKQLETKFDSVNYIHVPRGQNSEVDLVVNLTLDNQLLYL